jgi:hypothetical protein
MSLVVNLTGYETAYAVGIGLDGCWQVTAVVKGSYFWDANGKTTAIPAISGLTYRLIHDRGADGEGKILFDGMPYEALFRKDIPLAE